jgi:hypothetical protein
MTENLVKCRVLISKIMDGNVTYKKGDVFMWPESKAVGSTSVEIIDESAPTIVPLTKQEPEKAPEPEKEPEVIKLNKGGRPAKKV